MAGQAAVSVVVNLVQLVGAAVSLRSRREMSVQRGRTPEEISAFVSLAFTMGFLFVSFVAHGWLIRTPVYARLIAPLERRLLSAANAPGTEALLASTDMARSVGPEPGPDQETATERMARVARKNIVYEIAVAYVFVVTLVRPPFD
jgi:equilibrative nucleoside transporter 1/2/3